jgi:hypothetical protein
VLSPSKKIKKGIPNEIEIAPQEINFGKARRFREKYSKV